MEETIFKCYNCKKTPCESPKICDEIGNKMLESAGYTWKNEVWEGVKMNKNRFHYWTDFKLWILLPCIAFDFDSWEIWIEWLCFGFTYQFYNKYNKLYMDVKPEEFIWKESREIGK